MKTRNKRKIAEENLELLRKELEQDYELNLNKIIKKIKKEKVKKILLQFPDGLKPLSIDILNVLGGKTGKEFMIWQGSCYGACDLPPILELEKLGIDMIIQFGHAPWNYKSKRIKVLKF